VLIQARYLVRHLSWWLMDYAYAGYRVMAALLRRGGMEQFLTPGEPAAQPILLIPGVYESWRFMRPLAADLHRHGHPVHVVHGLGLNRGTIPAMAVAVAAHLRKHDLTGVVIVAHSKGGLIGKYAMVHHDHDRRICAMVTVNTPFAGSRYARWVPLAAVRAFLPSDAILAALSVDLDVNQRITTVVSSFDPHIPRSAALPGAANAVLRTPGHFRVLRDPELSVVVRRALARRPAGCAVAGGTTSGQPGPQ
jgi:triacylglycerol lipase